MARRFFRRLRMKHRILEPIGEVGRTAAFAICRRRLRHTFFRAGGTGDANMEMIIVAIHRPDLGEPAPIPPGVAAQRLLDCGVDEDTLYPRLRRGVADHCEMAL